MGVNLDNLRIDLPEKGKTASGKSSALWKIVSLVLALILAIFIIYHFASASHVKDGLPVETSPVIYSVGGSSSLFTAGGWIEPAFPFPVVVSALTSGRIEKLNVVESSEVEKGQIIAVLYKKDLEDSLAKAEAELALAGARLAKLRAGYRTEDVEQARAEAAQAQARLSKLEAGYRAEEVQKARATLEENRADEAVKLSVWQRSEKLFEKGAISKENLEKEKSAYEQAHARTQAVGESLKLLEAGYRKEEIEEARALAQKAGQNLKLLETGYRTEEIEEAQAQFNKATAAAQLARSQLSYTDIRAPVSGRVLELHAAQGDNVTAQKSAIVSIYNPQDMQVRVDVRQENIPNLRVGQSARVMIDARKNKPYEGEIIRIDPKANLARDTIRAKVKIISPDALLYPEMTATVDFLSKAQETEEKPSLIVPPAAVLSKDGKDFVFVIRQGRAYKTEVSLGPSSGAGVAVTSGLKEGDEVAISGINSLRDGQAVHTER